MAMIGDKITVIIYLSVDCIATDFMININKYK